MSPENTPADKHNNKEAAKKKIVAITPSDFSSDELSSPFAVFFSLELSSEVSDSDKKRAEL